MPQRPSSGYKCSICSEYGHNKRTCPTVYAHQDRQKRTDRLRDATQQPQSVQSVSTGIPLHLPIPHNVVATGPDTVTTYVTRLSDAVAHNISPAFRTVVENHVGNTATDEYEDIAFNLHQHHTWDDDGVNDDIGVPQATLLTRMIRHRQATRPTTHTYRPMATAPGFTFRMTDAQWANGTTYDDNTTTNASTVQDPDVIAFSDRSKALRQFSVTAVVTGSNIPSTWFDAAQRFLHKYLRPGGGKCAVAQEAGKTRGRIHLQMALEARVHNGDSGVAYLKSFLANKVLPWVKGRRIMVKSLTATQNINTLVGYVMKDEGCAHYRFYSVNISEAELNLCRSMYQVVRTTHEDGRKIVSKRSLVRMAWQEWNAHIRPLVVDLPVMIMWMLQSGSYMPAPGWSISGVGYGFL